MWKNVEWWIFLSSPTGNFAAVAVCLQPSTTRAKLRNCSHAANATVLPIMISTASGHTGKPAIRRIARGYKTL
jgi:hypothetical protein